MKKVIAMNFSRSEYEMHVPVFRVLFPSLAVEFCDGSPMADGDFSRYGTVLISCMSDERKALETLLRIREEDAAVVLYSERLPSVLFLAFVQGLGDVSLLFCPRSMDDVRKCGESVLAGGRYVSPAAQDRKAVRELGRYVEYESMSELNKVLLFSVFEGLSLKETGSLTGKNTAYIQTCLSRLRERFGVLERRELFHAMIRWVSVGEALSQSG